MNKTEPRFAAAMTRPLTPVDIVNDFASSWEPDTNTRFIRAGCHQGLHMLVERNLKVMNVAIIGDAYAIASNYLRKVGLISDTAQTNDRLLEIVIMMVHCGEVNKIRLANKAIVEFENARLTWS